MNSLTHLTMTSAKTIDLRFETIKTHCSAAIQEIADYIYRAATVNNHYLSGVIGPIQNNAASSNLAGVLASRFVQSYGIRYMINASPEEFGQALDTIKDWCKHLIRNTDGELTHYLTEVLIGYSVVGGALVLQKEATDQASASFIEATRYSYALDAIRDLNHPGTPLFVTTNNLYDRFTGEATSNLFRHILIRVVMEPVGLKAIMEEEIGASWDHIVANYTSVFKDPEQLVSIVDAKRQQAQNDGIYKPNLEHFIRKTFKFLGGGWLFPATAQITILHALMMALAGKDPFGFGPDEPDSDPSELEIRAIIAELQTEIQNLQHEINKRTSRIANLKLTLDN